MAEQKDWAEAAEQRLLEAAVREAGRLGWNARLLAAAAKDAGLSAGEAELLVPSGARDLAALYSAGCDRLALEALAAVDPNSMKVRERIRSAVLARNAAAMRSSEATRRWMGFLALPANLALGLRLAWASADRLWRWAGDQAVDENHYSKRALLSEILVSTLAVEIAAGHEAARRALDRRISAVMAFEGFKARWRLADRAQGLAERLARLRYGSAPGQDLSSAAD